MKEQNGLFLVKCKFDSFVHVYMRMGWSRWKNKVKMRISEDNQM